LKGELLQRFVAVSNAKIVEQIDVPIRTERLRPAPASFAAGPMLSWLGKMMAGSSEPRLHQSLAMDLVAGGKNVVVSTGTASGKSLVFQGAMIRELTLGQGRVLMLFPQKALGSDQEKRCKEALTHAGLNADLVGTIHGDIPMAERDDVLARSRVILATPDVIHCWLMRQASSPAVQAFLSALRLLVIDEAHVFEGVLGSNAAYLFRRLLLARQRSKGGNGKPVQVIAATATIIDPAGHLASLTGCDFEVVGEELNGAPFHGLTLLHIEGPEHGAPAERMAADIGQGLAETIGEDAFILFNDSRQGVERITRAIDRDDVLPYRGGYDHKDRRNIEARLHCNTARGIIATSALELGVDIPQFSIGINLGVPQTRKAFRQRVGRIGRNAPGLFVVIAPHSAFAQLGSSLREFYEGPVEPSHLYEKNRFIQFQQASCLLDECNTDELDELGGDWPQGFREMIDAARPGANRSRDLDQIASLAGGCPHLAYPLRAMCETSYALRSTRNPSEIIGKIELDKAIREAYPGATYHHLRQAHRVVEWRSTSYEHSIMLEPMRNAEATQPLLRTSVNASLEAAEIIDRRISVGEVGCIAEISLRISDSVEGYRIGNTVFPYRELRKSNARMSRRYHELPSTGILMRISQPWFCGEAASSVRHQVAEALKAILAVEHNVSPAELRCAHQNINLCSFTGAKPLDDAIVIFDNIRGGLRLSAPLYSSFATILERMRRGAALAGEEALVPQSVIDRLQEWHDTLERIDLALEGQSDLVEGEVLVFAPDSEVGVRIRGILEERKLLEPQFVSMGDQDVLMYRYESAPDVHAWVAHDQVQAIGGNWSKLAWNPNSNSYRKVGC
jgi:DEAD/DEAH box helicase domain-containing protein